MYVKPIVHQTLLQQLERVKCFIPHGLVCSLMRKCVNLSYNVHLKHLYGPLIHNLSIGRSAEHVQCFIGQFGPFYTATSELAKIPEITVRHCETRLVSYPILL